MTGTQSVNKASQTITVSDLGVIDYNRAFTRMLEFTEQRRVQPRGDEIWLCQHPEVYTQGQAGKPEHILLNNQIPVVQSNRGGQVTFHGPGQLIAYPLLDLKQRGFFVKELVFRLESAVISTLDHFGITGLRVPSAPGVYVRPNDPASHAALPSNLKANPIPPQELGLAKISALGIKVSRGFSYHGLAMNVDMDLRPFAAINPCGYAKLQTTDLKTLGVQAPISAVQSVLVEKLLNFLE